MLRSGRIEKSYRLMAVGVLLASMVPGCASHSRYHGSEVQMAKSCPSTSNCCCKSINASDCVVAHANTCGGTDRPIAIATP